MKPAEHKTVQSRILADAEVIGWSVVSREAAEQREAGFPARHYIPNEAVKLKRQSAMQKAASS
jgi:type I restriction enzyme R subunit